MEETLEIRKRIGKRMKRRRVEMNLTSEAFGKKIEVTKSMISKIENGHVMPSIELLNKASAVLDIPISYFLEENSMELNDEIKEAGVEAVYLMGELKEQGITIDEIKQIYEILKVTKRIK